MDDLPARFVLVIGTGWAGAPLRRAARMIGTTLADAGLGLVVGDSRGVDYAVAEAYCATRRDRGLPLAGAFRQVRLGWKRFFRRGGPPLPGYRAPAGCRQRVDGLETWKREAVRQSDAGIMIGGGRGALDIAWRLIERGKPVFPVPFTGGLTGNSDLVFREILRTWDSYPVPGVSRAQFLRLAEPWVSGTAQLGNLLRGTLAAAPDIFVSYRRSDAPAAAGRIAHDLAEHFGARRVFFDVQGIAPSRAWDTTIDGALAACKAGVVVIGRDWLAPAAEGQPPRLAREDDVVRRELAALLRQRKAVFPLLVEGAALPAAESLPDELRALLRCQATGLDNAGWQITTGRLIREIEAVLRDAA